jgi:hypothetical protein
MSLIGATSLGKRRWIARRDYTPPLILRSGGVRKFSAETQACVIREFRVPNGCDADCVKRQKCGYRQQLQNAVKSDHFAL